MFVYIVSDGIARAMPFLVMPILAIYMMPEEFGIASNYIVFTQLTGSLISLSTYSYFSVDFYKTNESDKPHLLSNLIYLNLFITIGCLILVPFLSGKLQEWFYISIEWQLLALLMMFFSAVIELFTIYLRLAEKARLYGKFQFIRSFLSAGLSLLFVAVFLWSWQGRIFGLLLTNLFIFLISIYFFKKAGLLSVELEKKRILNALKFGLPLLPHKLSTWISSGFERIFITKKIGITDTGLYSFGANISSAMTLFVNSFFNAFTPYVYKQLSSNELENDKLNQIKKSMVVKSYLATLAFASILVVCYFLLYYFVKLFFNEAYGRSLVYLPYFLISIFFSYVYSLFSIYIFFSKTTKLLGIFTISVALGRAIITIPLITHFGTIGAAYAGVIGSFSKAIIVAVYSDKVYPMPWLSILRSRLKLHEK